MRCDQARERFSERFDDALAGEQRAELDTHLRNCAACSAEFSSYRALFADLGPMLKQVVDGQRPLRPFPEITSSPRFSISQLSISQLLRPACWGLAAAIVAFLIVDTTRPGQQERPEVVVREQKPTAVLAQVMQHREPACPWYDATPEEIPRVISYPVVTEDCAGPNLELVQAKVQSSEPCPERVQLTYGRGERQLVLEQKVDLTPECCAGEHVLVGDVMGCLHSVGSETSLAWSQDNHRFHLRGMIPLGEVVQFAQVVSHGLNP